MELALSKIDDVGGGDSGRVQYLLDCLAEDVTSRVHPFVLHHEFFIDAALVEESRVKFYPLGLDT